VALRVTDCFLRNPLDALTSWSVDCRRLIALPTAVLQRIIRAR